AAMLAQPAGPGGSTRTPFRARPHRPGQWLGAAGAARTSVEESRGLASSVASRSCRWGPSFPEGHPTRQAAATDERSGSESAITIPGMGDHDPLESAIRIKRNE